MTLQVSGLLGTTFPDGFQSRDVLCTDPGPIPTTVRCDPLGSGNLHCELELQLKENSNNINKMNKIETSKREYS